jgi:cupin 2 domain-containing protein
VSRGNIFDQIPVNLEEEDFETLIKTDQLEIERIVSKGHISPEVGWYDQEQNEWVMVIKGEATIAFENEKPVTLKEGSYINIAARKKHRVIKTHKEKETIWLAVHY